MSNSHSRSSTLPDSMEAAVRNRQAADDTISAYVDSRAETLGVGNAYDRWARATPAEAADAYAAHHLVFYGADTAS
jgi:hypothetical protein